MRALLRRTARVVFFIGCVIALADTAAAQQARVTGTRVNIRQKPDFDAPVLVTVPQGTILSVLSRQGDWAHVELPPDRSGSKRTGFIAARFVEMVVTPSPADPPPTLAPAPAATPERPAPAPAPAPIAPEAPSGTYVPGSQDVPASPDAAGWTFVFPVLGGLWTDGYNDGWAFGGGIARRVSERLSLQGDITYSRWSDGASVSGLTDEPSYFLAFSANALWDIGPPSLRWRPYAGGGLVVVRKVQGDTIQTRPFPFVFPGDRETIATAQAVGGVNLPLTSRVGVKAEGRLHFFALDETLASLSILGGLTLCPTCSERAADTSAIGTPPRPAPVPARPDAAETSAGGLGLFVQGGLQTLVETDAAGVLVGGGAAIPVAAKVDVVADAHYGRLDSRDGFYTSGNGVYRFPIRSGASSVLAGGGLAFVHGGGETDVAPQILGGFSQALGASRRVFGQVRFLFPPDDYTAFMVLGGIAFR